MRTHFNSLATIAKFVLITLSKQIYMFNQYIQENKDRFLSELLELLKIPSVSADSKYDGDVRRTAEFRTTFSRNGG